MHLIEQFFHFSNECSVEQIGPKKWNVKNNNKTIILIFDEKFESKIFKGSNNPILGWESKRFDVKEATFSIVNSINWEGTCKFRTLVSVYQ